MIRIHLGNQPTTDSQKKLEKGLLVPSGNFILDKKVQSLDEFWGLINSEKSLFARHRMYPSAFFHSWQIRTINMWILNGWFWWVEPATTTIKVENPTCDICGEKIKSLSSPVFDENFNLQEGLVQCMKCLITKNEE